MLRMDDPHVESLTYKIVAGEGIEFDNPEPLEHEWNSFSFKLENGILATRPCRPRGSQSYHNPISGNRSQAPRGHPGFIRAIRSYIPLFENPYSSGPPVNT
jgi:hypothetical protein